jgi:hypothetical protein
MSDTEKWHTPTCPELIVEEWKPVIGWEDAI